MVVYRYMYKMRMCIICAIYPLDGTCKAIDLMGTQLPIIIRKLFRGDMCMRATTNQA